MNFIEYEIAEVTEREALLLASYHSEKADYFLACRNNQIKISNGDPLYKFGDRQTKQDWMNHANKSEQLRKHHRDRARYWKKYIKSMQG